VRRVIIPASNGAWGTIGFDWKSAVHASREKGVALTLGYNTGVFSILYRIKRHPNIMNMDGLEWKRRKWSTIAKAWLRVNEWLGATLSDHLVADHPVIAEYLRRHTKASKISMILYGSDEADERDGAVLEEHQLRPKQYYLVIARPEPENSILEIVSAYSTKTRKVPLVVLGRFLASSRYHAAVLSRAGPSVKFLGPIYDREAVWGLRRYAAAYIHGHQVGGTNPSLVESLAAGNPIIAHDNAFTRWVVGESGVYFSNKHDLIRIFDDLDNSQSGLEAKSKDSLCRYGEMFQQEGILLQYEELLQRFAEEAPLTKPARDHVAKSV
jgi:glycosyltransferase involved in cell wall biosynthesis